MTHKSHQQGPHGIPDFIDILSIEDKILYEELQKKVGSSNYRYNRNHRFDTLKEIFNCIHNYCERNYEDQWKRYLVCGICWFGDYIAINTRQLRLLISKSKSAINDALSKMGYLTVTIQGERASLLFDKIPYLCGHFTEFRKWSIRKQNPLPNEIAAIKKSNKNNNKIDKDICCMNNGCFDFYDEIFNDFEWEENCSKTKSKNDFVSIDFDRDVYEIFGKKECLNHVYQTEPFESICFKSEETSRVF